MVSFFPLSVDLDVHARQTPFQKQLFCTRPETCTTTWRRQLPRSASYHQSTRQKSSRVACEDHAGRQHSVGGVWIEAQSPDCVQIELQGSHRCLGGQHVYRIHQAFHTARTPDMRYPSEDRLRLGASHEVLPLLGCNPFLPGPLVTKLHEHDCVMHVLSRRFRVSFGPPWSVRDLDRGGLDLCDERRMGGVHAHAGNHGVQPVSGTILDYAPSHQVWVGRLDVALHLRSKEEEHARQRAFRVSRLLRNTLCFGHLCRLLLAEACSLQEHLGASGSER